MGSILFAFNFLFGAVCFAVVLCVIIFVPLTIYITPYSFWCGTKKGKECTNDVDLKKQSLFKTCKNATILYGSWISKKEPKF